MIKRLYLIAMIFFFLLSPFKVVYSQEQKIEINTEKITSVIKEPVTESKEIEDKKDVSSEENTNKDAKNIFLDEKLKDIWNGNFLNIENKSVNDILSDFWNGIINDENAQTMTFYDVLHRAEENSIEIKTAKSKTQQANYVLDEVKTEKNLTVSGNATGSYSQPVATGGDKWNWSVGISTNYLISNFGRFEDQKKIAWMSYILAKMDEERLLSELYENVSSSYLTTLELEGVYIVARSSVILRQEQMEIAKAKFEEGISPKYDMLTSLVSLKNAEQSLITAKKSRDLSKSNLVKMMGMSQTETINILKPIYISLESYELEDAISLGYEKRIEMSQTDLQIKIAQANIDLISKGMSPSLYWVNSYLRQNENALKKDYAFSSSINFNIPIFDGGATKARKNEAKEALKQAELSKESLERNIALQIKDALLQVEESKQKLVTAEATIDMAKEAYSISMLRYKENVGTYLELDDSTTGYLNALSSLASAYCDYEKTKINLLYSLGIIVDELNKFEEVKND